MSCYIINTSNIKRIVLSFRKQVVDTQHTNMVQVPGEEGLSDITELATMNRVGQMLIDQNVRSYNYRYGEEEQPEALEITGQDLMYLNRFTPVETLKALSSYAYQSCETPDWKETNAHKMVEFIRFCAISALPGYEDAEWI